MSWHKSATHGSHCAIFYHHLLSNYTQNTRFWEVPAQYDRWDDALQGATTIVDEVFQNITKVHKADGRCFKRHLSANYGSYCAYK